MKYSVVGVGYTQEWSTFWPKKVQILPDSWHRCVTEKTAILNQSGETIGWSIWRSGQKYCDSVSWQISYTFRTCDENCPDFYEAFPEAENCVKENISKLAFSHKNPGLEIIFDHIFP